MGLPPEVGATPAEKSGKNTVDYPWGLGFPPKGKAGNYADEAFHGKFPNKKAGDEDTLEQSKTAVSKDWIEGYTDGFATTAPVGSFDANQFGIYDLGGNVWEWCEDWYDASHKDRVLRGASWNNSNRENLLSSGRIHGAPAGRNNNNGFRCVVGVSAP